MEISFVDKWLRTLCENEDMAVKELGFDVAKKLHGRLFDMITVSYVADLPPVGNPGEIKSNPHPHFKIDLDNELQIIFCANHTNIPVHKNGKVDWTKVRRIQLLKIAKFK